MEQVNDQLKTLYFFFPKLSLYAYTHLKIQLIERYISCGTIRNHSRNSTFLENETTIH